MILWYSILNKLESKISDSNVTKFIDIRYLDKWIKQYPECFPLFVRNNKHKIIFNNEKYRYEFHKRS